MTSLGRVTEEKEHGFVSEFTGSTLKKVTHEFQNAKNRLLLLDYDGTLVGFNENPELAIPDQELLLLLKQLSKLPNTDIAIVSGRDKKFLVKWFGALAITLIAEHGYYIRQKVRNGKRKLKVKISGWKI